MATKTAPSKKTAKPAVARVKSRATAPKKNQVTSKAAAQLSATDSRTVVVLTAIFTFLCIVFFAACYFTYS